MEAMVTVGMSLMDGVEGADIGIGLFIHWLRNIN